MTVQGDNGLIGLTREPCRSNIDEHLDGEQQRVNPQPRHQMMAVEQARGGQHFDGPTVVNKPSLARSEDVTKLVNNFAGGVFLLIAAFHEGKPEAVNPLETIEKKARRCGDIILGRDPSWDVQPWNRPSRLGIMLKYLLPVETEHYSDAGTALFMHLAAQMTAISGQVDGGLPEEEAKKQIERICTDVTGRILGLGRV